MGALEDEIEAAVARAVEPLNAKIDRLIETIERRGGERLNMSELGRAFGLKPSAIAMRLVRGTSAVAKLPFIVDEDGHKTWARSDVEALLARGAR